MPHELCFRLADERNQLRNPILRVFVVIVQMRDKVSSGKAQREIHRNRTRHHPSPFGIVRVPTPLREVNEADPAVAKFTDSRFRIIRAAVPDDDDLDMG